MNAAHATLHESVAAHLSTTAGWIWLPEVTFANYGERGVIDILAWHAESRSLLIIELKTELVDPQGLVATMDRRVRLGSQIAKRMAGSRATRQRLGHRAQEPRRAPTPSTNMKPLLDRAFPSDGRTMRGWLRDPQEPRCPIFLVDVTLQAALGPLRAPQDAFAEPIQPDRAVQIGHHRA